MKVFAGAGESSGDRMLAALLHGLRGPFPDLEARGFGGPLSRAQGLDSAFPMEKMAVNGVGEVIRRGAFLASAYLRLKRMLRDFKPDLVLLVDYPGMNVGLARCALRLGCKVHYLAPPQLWAYRNAGARTLRLKEALAGASVQVLFPLEEPPYASWASHLCQGHFFALHANRVLSGDRLLLCPGSRSHLVRRNLPLWLDHLAQSGWTGGVDVLTPEFLAAETKSLIQNRFGIVVLTDAAQAFSRAASAVAFPGTMTLELFLQRIPTRVWAVLDPLTLWSGKRKLRSGFIALPNLLLDREVFPEWVGTSADFLRSPPRLPDASRPDPLPISDLVSMDEKMGSSEGVRVGVQACLELLD